MIRQRLTYEMYKPLLERFVSAIEEVFGEPLVSIVVYGSVARGDAGPESDVDVLLVLEDAAPVYTDRLRPLIPVLGRLRKQPCWKELETRGIYPSFSVMVFSREEADQNRYLYLDMVEDARILKDRGDFFRNRLRALSGRLQELGARKVQRDGNWYWDLKPDLVPGEVVAL